MPEGSLRRDVITGQRSQFASAVALRGAAIGFRACSPWPPAANFGGDSPELEMLLATAAVQGRQSPTRGGGGRRNALAAFRDSLQGATCRAANPPKSFVSHTFELFAL
mmetsp:Transcript_21446/g.61185  ORF Transcript_21446/g.61185 Transcript_21446/m.61185 type:complete len:108 (+) Transcript_21446:1066-1389(+)